MHIIFKWCIQRKNFQTEKKIHTYFHEERIFHIFLWKYLLVLFHRDIPGRKRKNMHYPNWNGKVIHRNWWICNKLQNVFLIQKISYYILSTFFGVISCKIRGMTVNAICKSRWIKGRISRLKGKEKNTFYSFSFSTSHEKGGYYFW